MNWNYAQASINLSNSPGREFSPQLQVTDNSAYVVWRGSDASNPEIMFWSEKGKVEAVPEVPRPEVPKQARPIIPVEQPDITVNMKQKKKMTLVAIKNNSDEPVYGIQIKLDDGKIRFAKARGWDRERVDESTIIIKSLERSLGKGGSLILLLIGDKQNPSFEWSVMDRLGNLFETGRAGVPEVGREVSIPSVSPAELALRHAPILYQETTDVYGGKADHITAFDYDGDWNGANNWDNLFNYDMSAVVYYSVVETPKHYFIIYAFFHPVDWCTGIPCDREHENDMEGVLEIIQKDETGYGKLLGTITVWHIFFDAVKAPNSPLDSDDTLYMEEYAGSSHPRLIQRTGGHALAAWPYIAWDEKNRNFKSGSGIFYYPDKSISEMPENANDRFVRYKLVDIFEEGGLWNHRDSGETFSSWGNLRGDRSGTCGEGSFNKERCQIDAASAPWAWDSKSDILPAGLMACHPALVAEDYFSNYEFDIEYTKNLYQQDTRCLEISTLK